MNRRAVDATTDAILEASSQEVKDAVDAIRLNCGENWSAPMAMLWLLDYGAKVYLATEPKEK